MNSVNESSNFYAQPISVAVYIQLIVINIIMNISIVHIDVSPIAFCLFPIPHCLSSEAEEIGCADLPEDAPSSRRVYADIADEAAWPETGEVQ